MVARHPASFYPAMQAQLIDVDLLYIDGGYRNNLPIDVAIERGATEVIAVDVQGPGINKKGSGLRINCADSNCFNLGL